MSLRVWTSKRETLQFGYVTVEMKEDDAACTSLCVGAREGTQVELDLLLLAQHDAIATCSTIGLRE